MTTLIAGILKLDGSDADEPLIEEMLDRMQGDDTKNAKAIACRGPFAAGVLRVLPKRADQLPTARLFAEADTLIAADIRLFDGTSDPIGRLADALDKYRENAFKDLNGDFALACWNGHKLILARDHVGARPLQYCVRPGAYVAFASLPQALLQTGLARRVLDAETLKVYPIAGMAVGPRTFFADIKSVQPAHTIVFDPSGSSKHQRYWRLPLGNLIRANENPDEIAGELRRLLEQAVRRRLPGTGPVATHLSGGLDSGSIAAISARTLSKKARSFEAFCLAEKRDQAALQIIDELPFAKAIASMHGNMKLQTVNTPDQITLMQNFHPDLFLSIHPEEPEEQILQHASQAGADLVLSGWGGDEVVTWRGHGNLAELFWTGQWKALVGAIKQNAAQGGGTPLAIFRRAVVRESLPHFLQDLILKHRGSKTPDWIQEIEKMLPAANRAALSEVPSREPASDSRILRRGGLEHWSLSGRLETFAQRGARYGVSYAFPMLDLDLLKFAVRIPAVLLKDEAGNRAIFRRAMKDVLPDSVRLQGRKLTPFPAETLRQSLRKTDMLDGLNRMRGNALINRYIDIDNVCRYVSNIREPEKIRNWMNETAEAGEQVVQYELYHVFAIWLAWYLDQHGSESE